MEMKVVPPEFPKSESVGEREWGEEILLILASGKYTLKQLNVKAGKKGGLQYHRLKDESSYIISGKLLLRYDDGTGKLVEKIVGPGEWFRFPPGCVHQEEALTDVVRIEVSTPHFNDRVRVEEKYGISEFSGLPTTSEDEIQLK
ncbi:cupin domain-containing protein [Leptospira jelokensis]|nr:cupin domain-containing protein [Leptospira jelokensis]